MYPVVLALGSLAGLVWLATRRGRSAEAGTAAFEAGLLSLGAGLLGARLGFVVAHLPAYLPRPIDVVRLWEGGLSGPGAMVGALAGAALYALARRRPFRPLTDALALPGLAVALAAWGGCTMESCVYGVEVAAGPFSPPGPDVFGTIAPRWPTAPVGLAASGLLLCAAILAEEWPLTPGRRGALALGGAALISLGLSFTRADPALTLAGLRLDAVAAAGVVLVAAILLSIRTAPEVSR